MVVVEPRDFRAAASTTSSEVATGGRYIYLTMWRGAAVERAVS